MASLPDPASRPSRLPLLAHLVTWILLAASFLSGILVWRGQVLQIAEMASPWWLQPSLIVHGCLNPFLCGLFGYLACQHIRLGWQIKANLISGLPLEMTFLGLILTGAGMYYAGSEDWRNFLVTTHRVLGLILPLAMGAHWITAQYWIKKISN